MWPVVSCSLGPISVVSFALQLSVIVTSTESKSTRP